MTLARRELYGLDILRKEMEIIDRHLDRPIDVYLLGGCASIPATAAMQPQHGSPEGAGEVIPGFHTAYGAEQCLNLRTGASAVLTPRPLSSTLFRRPGIGGPAMASLVGPTEQELSGIRLRELVKEELLAGLSKRYPTVRFRHLCLEVVQEGDDGDENATRITFWHRGREAEAKGTAHIATDNPETTKHITDILLAMFHDQDPIGGA